MGSDTSRDLYPDRIRISVLATELGVPFPGLFSEFCRNFPEHVDNDITVPAQWLPVLTHLQTAAPSAA